MPHNFISQIHDLATTNTAMGESGANPRIHLSSKCKIDFLQKQGREEFRVLCALGFWIKVLMEMMKPSLVEFRQLFQELNGVDTGLKSILSPWADRNSAILGDHDCFRRLNEPQNPYPVENDDLWSFYALSRVCDWLIAAFEPLNPVRENGSCKPASLNFSLSQFVDFWGRIGISHCEPAAYHPFWCEIAAIEEALGSDAPPQIEEIFWPALTFGDLLICRAGVRVRAGRDVLNPTIAATSPLYFTYHRANRKTYDLSHGWGHNSQWNTGFRRDYVWRDFLIFNADGLPRLNQPTFLSTLSWHDEPQLPSHRFFAAQRGSNESLNLEQREELLTKRSFVVTSPDDEEFWPYDDTLLLQIESA